MEILVVWIICGVVTAVIASSKGRNSFGWLLIGLLLGIFGIILIACLPSLGGGASSAQFVNTNQSFQATKACPDCGEAVLQVANVCKHCSYRFDGQKAVRL